MKKQLELFTAETTWFHVFKDMIDNGDVAKMGPYAVTVYLVIKSYTSFKTGISFPSIETISSKSGISERKVRSSLKLLEENEYISKEKAGRRNVYTLREKVQMKDHEGRPTATATWDYLPSTVEAARAELKRFQLTGEEGKIIHIQNMTLNIQINQGEGGNQQINFDSIKDKKLRERVKRAFFKSSEKQEKNEIKKKKS